jgi:flavin reductase (DIM6/NTAB) family NADH-FMN oxidoreductase RutF
VTDPSPSPADPVAFRGLMARWTTGVAVVTAREGSADHGLTVNALLSVSLAPPSLLVSLTHDADTTPVIERARTFAVNFLAIDQRAVSERFAKQVPPAEKFRDLAVHRGATGAALIDGSLGAAECRVVSWTPQYDHVLIVGEVVRQELGREAAPLAFYRSRYTGLDGAPAPGDAGPR